MSERWSPQDEVTLIDHLEANPKLQYHTIARLMGRTTDSIRNKAFSFRLLDRNEWVQEERVAFFDIEATNLKANRGKMISYAIKPLGGKVKYQEWTRKEAIDRRLQDKRIMQLLIEDLQEVDLLVTYYGTNFDNKFIRTRAMIWDLPDFPEFGTIKHFDLFYAVKGNLSLTSKSLATTTRTLGIEGKTPLNIELWNDAQLGYPDAMAGIKEHNVEDVKILEELYHKMLPHVKIIRKTM